MVKKIKKCNTAVNTIMNIFLRFKYGYRGRGLSGDRLSPRPLNVHSK